MDMMAVLPKAEAAEAPASANVPRWEDGKGWACIPPLVFERAFGTCVRNSYKRWPWNSPSTFFPKDCPEANDIAITRGGSKKCIPNEAWNAMAPKYRIDLYHGANYQDMFDPIRGQLATQDIVLGGGTHRPDGTPIQPNGEPVTPAEPQPAQAGQPGTQEQPAQPGAQQPGEQPPGQNNPPATNNAPPATNNPPQISECKKPELACGALGPAERKELIAAFRRDKKSDVCIMGGFFSKYKGGRKTPGNCDEKLAQKQMTDRGAHACKANKVPCNPAVFCVGLKVDDKVQNFVNSIPDEVEKKKMQDHLAGAATVEGSNDKILRVNMCEDLGQDLSKRCNGQLKEFVEGKRTQFMGANGKSFAFGESYVACNSAKVSGSAQDQWRTLRDDIEKQYKTWCEGDKKFSALFCTECAIIAERIIAANTAAIGSGCVDGVGIRPGSTTPANQPQQQAPAQPGSPNAIRDAAPSEG
jgi:hypothetical protein